jgi:glyoxylase-like metal-dependent hydrolase (beta-lactamase superfamily II)
MDTGIILKTIVVGGIATNCYVLGDDQTMQAIIVDPGADAGKIKGVLQKEKLTPCAVVLTHGHFDHIGEIESFGVPIYVHKNDAVLLPEGVQKLSVNFGPLQKRGVVLHFLENNDTIPIGNRAVRVLHTPGHTPGGICLVIDGILLSGDTLFRRGIGRTDLPGGSYEQLLDSLREKVLSLDEGIAVFPGHGLPTTIGEEKEENSFL